MQCDSMDGRVIGVMGHGAAYTPNLDALARRGMILRNTYCNNPICCPSRASTWSGQYTFHCEGWNNHKGLEPDTPTFQTRLDEGGYLTRTFGKTDYLSGFHTHRARVTAWTRSSNIMLPAYREPAPRVIDDEDGDVECHRRDWNMVRQCGQWLEETAIPSAKPFMLFCGIHAPHPGFRAGRRWLDLIDPSRVTLPPQDEQNHPVMAYQRTVKGWEHSFDEEMVRLVRRIYFAMIAEVDAMVGLLMRKVRQLGLEESTYFIFTSDHGEMNMEHRQYYKMNHYEPSARVPMIVAGPGLPAGEAREDLVSLVDLFPTLMDMAGLEHPAGLDGHSLLPLLQGRRADMPDWAFCEYHDSTANTGSFMVRREEWKYIAYVGYEPMLFNLQDDPYEVRNLAASLPTKVAEMDALLRSVVDYPTVDAKVKEYDKKSFRQWRELARSGRLPKDKGQGLCEGTYDDLMAQIYYGWTPRHEEMLQEWLGQA